MQVNITELRDELDDLSDLIRGGAALIGVMQFYADSRDTAMLCDALFAAERYLRHVHAHAEGIISDAQIIGESVCRT